jgi:hypothetical protein
MHIQYCQAKIISIYTDNFVGADSCNVKRVDQIGLEPRMPDYYPFYTILLDIFLLLYFSAPAESAYNIKQTLFHWEERNLSQHKLAIQKL